MGLNKGEGAAVTLVCLAISAVTLCLFDHGWTVIRDRDGTIYYGGILTSLQYTPVQRPNQSVPLPANSPNYTYSITTINNDELETKRAGQVMALVLFAGLGLGVVAAGQVFLVSSGVQAREKGHAFAVGFFALGGLAMLGACGLYSFLHPSDWVYHDDNLDFVHVGNATIAQPRKSVDHFGPSFVMTLVASAFYFWSGLVLYFSHARISFD